jgi:hypothetical protein
VAEWGTSKRDKHRGDCDEKFGLSAPSIRAAGPSAGSVRNFPNPVTGMGSMTVPVFTSPGRLGFGPAFHSRTIPAPAMVRSGSVGSCRLRRITRGTDKGLLQYSKAEEPDIFILSGAEDLVPVLVNHNGRWKRQPFNSPASEPDYLVQRYWPPIEGLIVRIERGTAKQLPMATTLLMQ